MIDPTPVPDFSNPRESVSFWIGILIGAVVMSVVWMTAALLDRIMLVNTIS